MTHIDAKKNECNFFWISDDYLTTSVVCRHCDEVTGDVDEGSLLQVRRYMHRNVVHVEDLSRAHDCRGIQSYVGTHDSQFSPSQSLTVPFRSVIRYYINQKRAILLEPKEQNAGSTPAFDTKYAIDPAPTVCLPAHFDSHPFTQLRHMRRPIAP